MYVYFNYIQLFIGKKVVKAKEATTKTETPIPKCN